MKDGKEKESEADAAVLGLVFSTHHS